MKPSKEICLVQKEDSWEIGIFFVQKGETLIS